MERCKLLTRWAFEYFDQTPRFPLGNLASPCWTVFSLRVRGTRIADTASDPQIWGSPRVDDDRDGPGAPILSSFVFLDTTGFSFERQDMRTLFEGLEEAFRFLDGVPKEILFDQMRSVIVENCVHHGGDAGVGAWKTARIVAHYSAVASAERGAIARYL